MVHFVAVAAGMARVLVVGLAVGADAGPRPRVHGQGDHWHGDACLRGVDGEFDAIGLRVEAVVAARAAFAAAKEAQAATCGRDRP